MIFLVLSFFFLASFEKPPLLYGSGHGILFSRPSLICTATAMRFARSFFFLPLCLKLEFFQSDLRPDPGYLHIYTLGVMRTSFRPE
jgi:hypothetical protein